MYGLEAIRQLMTQAAIWLICDWYLDAQMCVGLCAHCIAAFRRWGLDDY